MAEHKGTRILLVTQKADRNDSVLGFFHRWMEAFSEECERVTVICLEKGECVFPENVTVLSLGKEKNRSRLLYLVKFYWFIVSRLFTYDSVLVHMNHEYVLLGGLIWRLAGKRVGLWYAHGHVPRSLRPAALLSHVVFSSTESGFRLASKKKKVIGQGIDTDFFSAKPNFSEEPDKLEVITVGRISPVKDYETMLEAVRQVVANGFALRFTIIGEAGLPEQRSYEEKLKAFVREAGLERVVVFKGALANRAIKESLHSSDLFINAGKTGSLDKAILEAMSSAVPVFTSNEALVEVLGEYKNFLMFPKSDSKALAQKIIGFYVMGASERRKIGEGLREIVVRHHGLSRFVRSIVSSLS